ncbi:MAG: membrane protein insertase YidC [Methylobacterium sp.]|nr:membrane protein insertase YidC [Methylobacterium sp.]
MKSDDNRNLLLAITLSVVVMVGWNYLFGMPKLEQQRQQQVQGQTGIGQPGSAVLQPPAAPGAGAPAPSASAPGAMIGTNATLPREQALALSPRVRIESPSLSGSISLIGGRIDDLSLVRYRETVDPKSNTIVLFAPPGAKDGYFADFGWLPAAGQNVPVPGPDTRWEASVDTLRPGGTVTLTYDNGQGLVFTRVITMDDRFLFTVTNSVRNSGTNPVTLSSYGRITRQGTPPTLGFFILHEGLIGYLDDKLQEMTFADAVKAKTKTFAKNSGGWLGITEKYWASALIPAQDRPFSAAFGASGPAASPTYETAAISEASTLAPGAETSTTMHLFAGAKEFAAINTYQETLKAKNFDLMIDWGWFYFITKPLFHLMEWVFGLVGNFGVTILIVTVLIKLALFPLANKSYESMARMKHVQPEMLAIRDRYADDKTKQQQAMMELYKKEKINPLAGCLPVLVQIPIFFALYKVLFVTIEMRHAPFFGWIRDLAAPDPTSIFNLFGLLPFNPGAVPVFGPFLMLGIWPIIMGITMWVQMKMNPEPTDPIQKAVFAWMPLLFTFMLASFPAGLVIYWAWNNTLSVLQQYAIMKKLGTKVELWDNLKSTFKRG